jgi:hypothetical protein
MTITYSFKTLDYTLNGVVASGGTLAFGINDLGQVAGYYSDPTLGGDPLHPTERIHGFEYSGGVYSLPLDPYSLGAVNGTDADGINDSGQIVGGFANGVTGVAYVKTGGTYTIVPANEAFGINDAGEIVGVSGTNGFLDINGAITTLSYTAAGADVTAAQGISNDGHVVGYYSQYKRLSCVYMVKRHLHAHSGRCPR